MVPCSRVAASGFAMSWEFIGNARKFSSLIRFQIEISDQQVETLRRFLQTLHDSRRDPAEHTASRGPANDEKRNVLPTHDIKDRGDDIFRFKNDDACAEGDRKLRVLREQARLLRGHVLGM